MSLLKRIRKIFISKSQTTSKSDFVAPMPPQKGKKTSLNNWSNEEIKEFKQSLAQVINWTQLQIEKGNKDNTKTGLTLRSINPEINGKPIWEFKGDYAIWDTDQLEESTIKKLLEIAINLRPDSISKDLNRFEKLGRILSFETCITTVDGAPIIESNNFVDECDIPPIDTWFYVKENYEHKNGTICSLALFCWIPKKFETNMQNAIDVEILDSYRWLDENDSFILNELKR